MRISLFGTGLSAAFDVEGKADDNGLGQAH